MYFQFVDDVVCSHNDSMVHWYVVCIPKWWLLRSELKGAGVSRSRALHHSLKVPHRVGLRGVLGRAAVVR